jgi:hypothetical protein
VTAKLQHFEKFGDELFSRFVANAPALGVEQIIWNKHIWSVHKPYVHPYRGKNPHTGHLHVGFSRVGSQNKPPLLITLVKEAADIADTSFSARKPAGTKMPMSTHRKT